MPRGEAIPCPHLSLAPLCWIPAKRVLLREGGPQYLSPKAFDVLLLLVERRERVLSKEELLSTLWPDRFVEEANLSQQIFGLRRTLNGDADGLESHHHVPPPWLSFYRQRHRAIRP